MEGNDRKKQNIFRVLAIETSDWGKKEVFRCWSRNLFIGSHLYSLTIIFIGCKGDKGVREKKGTHWPADKANVSHFPALFVEVITCARVVSIAFISAVPWKLKHAVFNIKERLLRAFMYGILLLIIFYGLTIRSVRGVIEKLWYFTFCREKEGKILRFQRVASSVFVKWVIF